MSTLKTIAMVLFPWWIIWRQNKVIEKQKIFATALTDKIIDTQKKLAGAAICRFDAMPQGDDLLDGKCWLTYVNLKGWIFDSPSERNDWSHWLPHWFIPLATAPTELLRHDSGLRQPWEDS